MVDSLYITSTNGCLPMTPGFFWVKGEKKAKAFIQFRAVSYYLLSKWMVI